MNLYKIYTENKSFDSVMGLTGTYFPEGFTITKSEGHYDGASEHCLVIDIVTDRERDIFDLAWDIKKCNAQKGVLVVTIPCDSKMV